MGTNVEAKIFCYQNSSWKSSRSRRSRRLAKVRKRFIFRLVMSEEGQVEVNAFGSPIAAQETAQDIVRGGDALVATDENVRDDLRVVLRVSVYNCFLE